MIKISNQSERCAMETKTNFLPLVYKIHMSSSNTQTKKTSGNSKDGMVHYFLCKHAIREMNTEAGDHLCIC